MMIFNMCIFPVRIQMTNTQNMNNSEMSTQNIPNFQVCSSDESKSNGGLSGQEINFTCILTVSPVSYLFMILYVIQKLGVTRILQFISMQW